MLEIICLLTGGALGSITRYSLGKKLSSFQKNIPIGTFLINITGAFLLGLVSNLNFSNITYIFLAEGFLGAYTTFSTFMYEDFVLLKKNKILSAFLYITITMILSLFFFYLGDLI
ncbi:fluoride efflux transporter CrcB [Eubacteriaceae bacterium ES2]|nr:fluoride efflux transporter CrcB [Eubacteriaceae bacterium ES2]